MEVDLRCSHVVPACRSMGLQVFDRIEKRQEAEAIKLIDQERRSAYIRDAKNHGYVIHHAVFQVPFGPWGSPLSAHPNGCIAHAQCSEPSKDSAVVVKPSGPWKHSPESPSKSLVAPVPLHILGTSPS